MKIFDCFKYVVRLPSIDAGFFVPLCPPCPLGNYLVKISSDPLGCCSGFCGIVYYLADSESDHYVPLCDLAAVRLLP